MREDLTNQIFGGLRVIDPAPSRKSPSGLTRAFWNCECLKCGSIKEYSSQCIKKGIKDCGCAKTPKMEVGKQYGMISVLSISDNGQPKRYNCKCENCGKIFTSTAQSIRTLKEHGCADCHKSAKDSEKIESLLSLYKGKEYGELTILNIKLQVEEGRKDKCLVPYAFCRCRCGKEKNMRLYPIVRGVVNTCGHDTGKNLKYGSEILKQSSINGTNVLSILPKKHINKNSSTGITGVTKRPTGEYIAYINFQRKQYSLGSFNRIEDAVQARKNAEAEIYGKFLDWYAQEYPERWEKIKQKESGKAPEG